jgi:hypothetical protein
LRIHRIVDLQRLETTFIDLTRARGKTCAEGSCTGIGFGPSKDRGAALN